jgi:hypothetical protein
VRESLVVRIPPEVAAATGEGVAHGLKVLNSVSTASTEPGWPSGLRRRAAVVDVATRYPRGFESRPRLHEDPGFRNA